MFTWTIKAQTWSAKHFIITMLHGEIPSLCVSAV